MRSTSKVRALPAHACAPPAHQLSQAQRQWSVLPRAAEACAPCLRRRLTGAAHSAPRPRTCDHHLEQARWPQPTCTSHASALCTRISSPVLLLMTVRHRCVCRGPCKDDVYERARCAMFGVGLESQHDYLPQRLRSALRKSSPWSAASADLNGAPPPPPLPNDRRPRVRTPVGQRPSSSPCSCTHTCTACAPAAHAPRCWQRILLTTNNPGAQVLQAAADARARALCYVWAVSP